MGDGHYITFDIITDTKRVASSQSSFDKQLESLQYNEFYDKDWVDNAYAGRLTEDVIYGASRRKISNATRNLASRFNVPSVGAFDSDDTTSQSYQDFNSSTITRGKTGRKIRGMQSGFRARECR